MCEISCQIYLERVLDGHKWQEHKPGIIPMRNDITFQVSLDLAVPPIDPAKQMEMSGAHFNYRHVIREIIYAIVTCRLDISYAVIQLSTKR